MVKMMENRERKRNSGYPNSSIHVNFLKNEHTNDSAHCQVADTIKYRSIDKITKI